MLHSERFVDVSPEETWATLLDEGTYLCSTRTMYRILAAHHGGVRDRRDQLTHPPTRSPSCSPSGRTSCGRGTCRKLKGPAKWTYYYLYVILDVFSRYIVGWTVQYRENGAARQGADRAGDRAAADHPQDPDAARRPRRAAARQAGRVPARRPRRHQDAQPPVHLQRQPLLGVELQDPEVPARVPRPVRRHRARPRSLPRVRRLVQPRAPPLRDRADDPRRRPPRPRARSCTPPAPHVLDAAYARNPERFVRKPPAPPELPTAAWINKPEGGRRRSLNSNTKRLTGLDRLRTKPSTISRSRSSPIARRVACWLLAGSRPSTVLCARCSAASTAAGVISSVSATSLGREPEHVSEDQDCPLACRDVLQGCDERQLDALRAPRSGRPARRSGWPRVRRPCPGRAQPIRTRPAVWRAAGEGRPRGRSRWEEFVWAVARSSSSRRWWRSCRARI